MILTDWGTLADPALAPEFYDIGLRPSSNAWAYAHSFGLRSAPDHRFASGINDTGPIFRAVIILIGTVMSLLEAALGVVSTVVLTTVERVRDLGVFKAAGMTPRQAIAMIVCWVAGTRPRCTSSTAAPAELDCRIWHSSKLIRILSLMRRVAGTGALDSLSCSIRLGHLPERVVCMPPAADPAGPRRDEDPAGQPGVPVPAPDVTAAEEDWPAWCDAAEEHGVLADADEEEPSSAVSWECDLDAVIAECRRVSAQEAAAAARAARLGLPGGQPAGLARRGPGQPGSARLAAGEFVSRAAGFGAGMALDVMPGCGALAGFAAEAAGEDDRYAGAGDDEVAGAISGWDRVEAYACARKHAAAAEWIRRRPGPGCAPQGPARLPACWDEFAVTELAALLAESPGTAEGLLELARDLAGKLPGTMAAFLDGIVSRYKAQIIAAAAALLDPAEARAAEALVLGRAGRLTPGGLRAAIARAVMQVAPGKARRRREAAARDARVQRWAEDSGNAALTGRELPPAEVLAADQRITARARVLKAAGLEGDMDVLRARAYLDLLLGKDSRPRQDPPGPGAGGFAGKVTLTVPVSTVTGRAGRPGEIPGIGPVDPALARELAAAAARNPRSTWCVTVTDSQGHAIGHGCARPEPKSHRQRAGPGPPGGTGFSFTPAGQPGPPGGYGTWRLRIPGGGPDLLVTLDPITTENCDHRFQARGHDPGVKLRHLTQVRNATCTGPVCRRPSAQADFEHNTPYEAGGRTCLCNGGPKCRHDHRLKQHPRWKAEQLPDGTVRWTTPSGRQYTSEPTRYPI